ncbi:hypothetical protein Rain11_2159 [Raineya orbicola]|jgi:hypothetical protein|uniref:Uncharacterized protein n=2 Tax=Raineya orbicola TaxID=2016530 RepID=A0A2N3I9M0_9BACT|nr:hypothetical protein Rain11_2159 [Raineya orbicola]
MSVKRLRKELYEKEGLRIRVYTSATNSEIASDDSTLRKVSFMRIPTSFIELRGNMLVDNFEKLFLERFGVRIEVLGKDGEAVSKDLSLNKANLKEQVV